MKAVNVVKKVVITIIVVVFFLFAIAMTFLLLTHNKYGLSEFNGYTLVLINDEVSSDKYEKGDLVIVKYQKVSNIKVGDEVFTYAVATDGSANVDFGIVGKVIEESNAVQFENGSTYSQEYVAGSPHLVFENLGTYLNVILSKWGFLFIILVPSFLIFIFEVYELIIEIKYGEDDDEDEDEEEEVVVIKKKKPEEKKKVKKIVYKDEDGNICDKDGNILEYAEKPEKKVTKKVTKTKTKKEK